MLRLLILWEVQLAMALVLVASGEVIALIFARRKGLTRNVSRLVTHGFIAAISLIYAAGAFWTWRAPQPYLTFTSLADGPSVHWIYPLMGTMIGLVAIYELWQHARAMARGLTGSVPRLITHLVMVLLIVMLIGLSVSRSRFQAHEFSQQAPHLLHCEPPEHRRHEQLPFAVEEGAPPDSRQRVESVRIWT